MKELTSDKELSSETSDTILKMANDSLTPFQINPKHNQE